MLYFATLGSFLPYWSLYLESLGFNALEIGELIALLVGTKMIAANIWGWIADRSGHALLVIRIASLIASITFLAVFLDSSFAWIVAVTIVFSFFWNAALPQFETLTLAHLKNDPHGYSRVRVWGSIGFVVTVLAVGWLLDDKTMAGLPVVIAVLLGGIWLASMLVPGVQVLRKPRLTAGFGTILRQPTVLAFLAVVCLVQVAHGPYYVFYSIYLEQHGYENSEIGQLWSLGVLAEVVLFFYMHRILKWFSLKKILLISVLTGAIRWLLIGYFIDQPWILVFAQLLHATTFGSTHIAAIHIVHQYFPHGSHGRGQAIYSSMSFGLGGMVGSFVSGKMWDDCGPVVVYGAASVVCVVAFMIGWRWIRIGECVEQIGIGDRVIEEEL